MINRAVAVAAVTALVLHPAGAFLVPHNNFLALRRPVPLSHGVRAAPAGLQQRSRPIPKAAVRIRRATPVMQAELAGVADAVQAQIAALTLDDIAGGLFAVSLFPYLGFLYHLGKPENKTPELGLFGFKFLLVFVGASIPAAIAAKVWYGAQLADVDYLHGGAESFLALTNLFIVLGFRRAVAGTPGYTDAPVTELLSSPLATAGALAGALFLTAQGLPGDMMALSAVHPEPANALSFPTCVFSSNFRHTCLPHYCCEHQSCKFTDGCRVGIEQMDGAHEFAHRVAYRHGLGLALR